MKQNYCDISIVLDRSGSMESIREDVIGGFNTFLDSQQKVSGDCTISLYQFDDVYETVYEGKDIKNASELTKETYVPRNMTALLDAIGKTINKTGNRLSELKEENRPSKVIFVIQTDGLENASKEFTKDKIFEMIKHQRENYNWEFVFLGANQDAIATATSYGINRNASYTYAGTSKGVNMAYNAINCSVTRARTSNSSVSFTDQERKEQEEELNKIS